MLNEQDVSSELILLFLSHACFQSPIRFYDSYPRYSTANILVSDSPVLWVSICVTLCPIDWFGKQIWFGLLNSGNRVQIQ